MYNIGDALIGVVQQIRKKNVLKKVPWVAPTAKSKGQKVQKIKNLESKTQTNQKGAPITFLCFCASVPRFSITTVTFHLAIVEEKKMQQIDREMHIPERVD